MSSVMMLTTVRPGSNAATEPPWPTRTRVRPCGRLAASRAWSRATAATGPAPAAARSSSGTCR